MCLDIREAAPTSAALSEHAAIPIAFVVDRVLEVRLLDGGLGGMSLTQTAVTDPYVKDYDALEGAGPQCWPGRFDVSNWALIGARRDGASVGGTVIATRTPGLHMLGGRDDVAVLWDIRVSPRERGGGIGSALFRAAGDWAGPAASGGSRSRPRTSTFRPAASTRRWAAPWAPSTGSPIPVSQPRRGCCGGRPWHRLTRTPADLISALNHKLVPLPRRPAHRRPIRVGFKAYAAHAE